MLDGSRIQPGVHDHARLSLQGTIDESEPSLVGFYSASHHGVFTHMGRNSHVHVIDRAGHVTGHVDHVVIHAGARLRLPAADR